MPLIMGLSVVVTGLIISGLSIPLILGKVAPNGLYGVRTAKTMRSPQAWYAGNVFGGKALLVAGITTIVVGVLIPFLNERFGLSTGAVQILGVLAELGPIVIALIVTLAYLRTL